MIELGTDCDDRVYARWAPGGPWTVLDRDGRVTIEAHAVNATPYAPDVEPEPCGCDAGYDEGYEDGYSAAKRETPVKVAAL